ncbi:hypothetical protein MKX01_013786 [Papaver californicum]|nr:hypothetical protein MKX01_013786 [Papaver californicum]
MRHVQSLIKLRLMLVSQFRETKNKRGSKGVCFIAQPLSNIQRLLLRKKAFTMIRHSVLAIVMGAKLHRKSYCLPSHFLCDHYYNVYIARSTEVKSESEVRELVEKKKAAPVVQGACFVGEAPSNFFQ